METYTCTETLHVSSHITTCMTQTQHLVLGLRGVLCAIICLLILTLNPRRGPIGD